MDLNIVVRLSKEAKMACCSCLRICIQIPRTQRKKKENSIVIQVLLGAGDRKITEACCLPALLQAQRSKVEG